MAKYKTVQDTVDALQFTGSNGATIANIVGKRAVDPAGVYLIPNFDSADTWLPGHEPDVVAVIFVNYGWQPVRINDWLVRDSKGNISVESPTSFAAKYTL